MSETPKLHPTTVGRRVQLMSASTRSTFCPKASNSASGSAGVAKGSTASAPLIRVAAYTLSPLKPIATIGRKRATDTPLSPDLASFIHECPICLSELTEPKLLHCGHNLCLDCANNTASNGSSTSAVDTLKTCTRSATKTTRKITCPMCQQVTESSMPLATNYALKETVETAKRMKLHFEAKVEELNKSSASNTNKEPLIACADCGESCEEERAFACVSPACMTKQRMTVATHYTLQESYILTMVVGKKLCGYCACLAHRQHKLEKLSAMASESLIKKATRMAMFIVGQLQNLCSNSKENDGNGIGNIYEMVLSTCMARLEANKRKLQGADGPLLKTVVETIDSQNCELLKRVKVFINDKAEMKKLGAAVRQQAFNAFQEKNADLLK